MRHLTRGRLVIFALVVLGGVILIGIGLKILVEHTLVQ